VNVRLRPWQLAALGIGISVALVATAVYWRRARDYSAAELASLLPDRNGALFFADVALIRKSGAFSQLTNSPIPEEAEYRQFVEQTGFDYKSDLDGLLAYQSKGISLFLAKGSFDWKRLSDYAQSQGGKCVNGFCSAPTSKPGSHLSFFAIDKRTMGVGIGPNPSVARRLKTRVSKEPDPSIPDQPLWLLLPESALAETENLPAGTRQFAKLLAGAERTLFTLGPSGNRFELVMDVTCKTAEQAAVLRTDFQNLTVMLKNLIAREKQQPNPADLSGVLTAGSFSREDRHVIGRWPLEPAFLQSLGGD
jgi:hypothetical protein